MTVLIPDASALINLCDVYIGRDHVIDVLNDLFDVQVPTEVVREVKRRKAKLLSNEKEILKFIVRTKQQFYREQDYENTLFNNFSPAGNPAKNRGERYVCSLALYRVRKLATAQIIILIDDIKAQRGLVAWYDERFKSSRSWSSLDLLLHIYLVKFPKWPLAQVRVALRSVNARAGGKDAARRLVRYRRCLKDLHDILTILPRVKGAL